MFRKPRWRSEGAEPDYRFSLANERTFLAWIRTVLALLAGSVLLEQFASSRGPHAVLTALAIALSVLAAILSALAYVRWRSNEIAMRHSKPLPNTVAIQVAVVVLAMVAVAIAVLSLA